MFDAHHDALFPRSPDARKHIASLRKSGYAGKQLLDLCERDLCGLDDDWITAGMLLGIFSDGAIFGVRESLTPASITDASLCLRGYDLAELRDPDGVMHHIHMHGFPGGELGYQGDLSDQARAQELTPLWQTLDWGLTPCGFGMSGKPFLLSIDLVPLQVD